MKADARTGALIAQAVAYCERNAKPAEPTPCPCGCKSDHPTCCRCSHVAELADRRGDPTPTVALVETWLGETGRRYFSGLCRECADIEWSLRWDRAYMKASPEGKKTLLERVAARERSGRNYLGVKRPGGPSGKHASACRCVDCRAAALEETSLFPAGYGT